MALTHRAERPRKIDIGAAAREQQVVVELVAARGRALEGRAFDAEDDGRVGGREEDVAAEAVRGVFVAEGETLAYIHTQSVSHSSVVLQGM